MSILRKLKIMFGAGDSDLEEEINGSGYVGRDATVRPLARRRDTGADVSFDVPSAEESAAEAAAAEPQADVELPEVPTAVPQELFATVVELFNESLPPFLQQTVDVEAQKKAVYDRLSESMKEYVDSLATITERRVSMRWENERSGLHREMEQLRQRSKRVEDSSTEWREQKLSAERQKRALSERVHDLEKQIDAFAAEREQYELENKTLVNKLRLLSVQDGDTDTLRADYAALQQEVARLRAAAAEGGAAPAQPDEETLRALEQTRAEADEARAKLAELTDTHDALQREADAAREKYQSELDVMKKRAEIADAMINDLNHKATAAQLELNGREKSGEELERLNTSLKEAQEKIEGYEADLVASRADLAASRADLEAARTDLAAANAEVEEAHGLMQQFEQTLTEFEELKEKKNRAIADLQERLRQADEKAASLGKTIEENLRAAADNEAELRRVIEDLRRHNDNDTPRRGRPRSVPSTDPLDDMQWIDSPREPRTSRRDNVNRPNDDTPQLSLW